MDYNDSQLMNLVAENDENAKNILYQKYNYIILVILKKYARILKQLQIDYKESYSEALYGFSDALNSFNETKDASLPTFITLCVERRIIKYIRRLNSQKNRILNETYSLDFVYDEYGKSLADILSDNDINNPLNKITKKEDFEELYNKIKDNLSNFEFKVLEQMLKGLNYNEIAIVLEKESKQIDNTIQRIKNKVKKIINT